MSLDAKSSARARVLWVCVWGGTAGVLEPSTCSPGWDPPRSQGGGRGEAFTLFGPQFPGLHNRAINSNSSHLAAESGGFRELEQGLGQPRDDDIRVGCYCHCFKKRVRGQRELFLDPSLSTPQLCGLGHAASPGRASLFICNEETVRLTSGLWGRGAASGPAKSPA